MPAPERVFTPAVREDAMINQFQTRPAESAVWFNSHGILI